MASRAALPSGLLAFLLCSSCPLLVAGARVGHQPLTLGNATTTVRAGGRRGGQAFVCGGLEELQGQGPETLIAAALTKEYVRAGSELARAATKLALPPVVLFCADHACVEAFWSECSGCVARVYHCPEYAVAVEPVVAKISARCTRWRLIQYIKSFALYDLVLMKNRILFMDLDHALLAPTVLQDLEHNTADIVVMKRDGSGLLNFGAFFARDTPAVLEMATLLKDRVLRKWDQAAFNEILQRLERKNALRCVMGPKNLGFKDKVDAGRLARACGLDKLYGIRNGDHPRCKR
mmetsp:Transcript_85521/g.242449  ORF Transcript_85521/g.242449 Transcript_85521/m.242449 type:complete len:292 (-) Transcript_85521:43-918(-)